MPTIAQSKASPEEVASAIATAATAPPSAPAIPDYPASPSFLRSSLPQTQQMQPDSLRQFYRKGTPQTRIAPLPANALPAINAAAGTVASTVIEETGGTVLETNNVENADQSTLNLKAGANVTLTADAFGGVTVAASGGGTPAWTPNQVTWFEDFTSLAGQAGSSLTTITATASFGTLGWYLDMTSSASVASGLVAGGVFPFVGYPWWSNTATASQSGRLYPSWTFSRSDSTGTNENDWNSNPLPLFDYPSWQMSFVFRLNPYLQGGSSVAFSMAKKAIYVGLFAINPDLYGVTSGSSTRPHKFCGVRFDTSATSPAISDSFLTLEVVNNAITSTLARNNTQGSTAVTTAAPTAGMIYRLDIVSAAAGSVRLTLYAGATMAALASVGTLTATMGKSTEPIGGNFAEIFSGGMFCTGLQSGSNTDYYTSLGAGSKVTFSGITTATYTQLNGVTLTVKQVMYQAGTPGFIIQCLQSTLTSEAVAVLNGPPGPEVQFYPAVYPGAWFGNDDTASPTASTAQFEMDKIYFNWT